MITTLRHFTPLPLEVQHHRIDVNEVQKAIHGANPDLLVELGEFGTLMMDEVLARSDALETKALSCLGWATTLLAFLLWGTEGWAPKAGKSAAAVLIFCAIAALAAAWFSFDALRVRKWTWASQRDWFQVKLFSNANALRAYHLLSLLEHHETRSVVNNAKARSLQRAELALLVAAALILIAFVLRWPI